MSPRTNSTGPTYLKRPAYQYQIREKPTRLLNMRQLQFMFSAVGIGTAGKKRNTETKLRKQSAAMLMKRPALPRLKRARRSSVGAWNLLARMQDIAMIYEKTSPS